MNVALTIAATDSSGGAGVQTDLAVFRSLGVHGVCAVTNITAQDSREVHKICKTPPRIVAAQIDAVTRDFRVKACKVGMLFAHQTVDVVAERISRRDIPNVVLDPVMAAKGGRTLLTGPALKRLRRVLLPMAALVTPNAPEAECLTGMRVSNAAEAKAAAEALLEMGAKAALVKGGHIEGDPIDVFYDGRDFVELPGSRLATKMRGTGCALSSAITARLAVDDDLRSAVEFAKAYVFRAIENSVKLGKGDVTFFRGDNK